MSRFSLCLLISPQYWSNSSPIELFSIVIPI